MQRRSFITGMAGLLAAGAAPAVIIPGKPGILMPVRRVWQPPRFAFPNYPNGVCVTFGDVLNVGFDGRWTPHYIGGPRLAGRVLGVNIDWRGQQQLVYAP